MCEVAEHEFCAKDPADPTGPLFELPPCSLEGGFNCVRPVRGALHFWSGLRASYSADARLRCHSTSHRSLHLQTEGPSLPATPDIASLQ